MQNVFPFMVSSIFSYSPYNSHWWLYYHFPWMMSEFHSWEKFNNMLKSHFTFMITASFTLCVLLIFHVIKINPIDGKTTNSHELRANLHHGKSLITRQNVNGYCLISIVMVYYPSMWNLPNVINGIFKKKPWMVIIRLSHGWFLTMD